MLTPGHAGPITELAKVGAALTLGVRAPGWSSVPKSFQRSEWALTPLGPLSPWLSANPSLLEHPADVRV